MQTHLPTALLNSLKCAKGFDYDAFVEAHHISNQITSVRINPKKAVDINHTVLEIDGNIPWCSNGFYLSKRPSFTLDPLFHAGAYYVQEASSMFLEEALKQTCNLNKSLKVLDLCAAPGGKSTLIQSVLSTDSILISNEVIKTRVNILNENITKWGSANVVVTNNDPKDFQRLPEYFDVIVVDAPCSGSGLFRKDPKAVEEWSTESVSLCSQRQQRILTDILPALKPDGILIYSTCSYSTEENEEVADWLIEKYHLKGLEINLKGEWNIVQSITDKHKAPGYRFYPDKVKGEGFFISAFQKNNETTSYHAKKLASTSFDKISQSEKSYITQWINNDSLEINLLKWKNDVIALPFPLFQEAAVLQSALYIKKMGVNMGSMIRNELIPSHQLAMSNILSANIPLIEVDIEKALDYLRLNTFNVQNTTIGWHIVRFSGMPLGFIKILQNRINNYYPKEWRILFK
jgi:NOL1/NOP2/sun family putative RNA methylase